MNVFEGAAKTKPNDVAHVNGERTDEKTKVDEDDGDNKAWKNALDAVIINAGTSNLRENNDEEKDDEDDIGKTAHIFPNDIDRRSIFH